MIGQVNTMDIKEVAKAFKVSESTIRRWVVEKKLLPINQNPYLKKVPKFLFNRSDIERLLNP